MNALDGVDAGRLFYLSALLLMVMSAALIHYQSRLGTGLQHAAIWALIFLGAVLAYGFRDTLSTQLTGAPQMAAVQDGLALRRGPDGHFHARTQVNGATIDFLVDTGATDLVLSQQDARRAGLDPARLSFVQPARTANGVVYSAPVTLDRLSLGPFEDRDVRASVNGGELSTSLMGMSYLSRFTRVTVEGDRMLLER